jgi:hypothetical protein
MWRAFARVVARRASRAQYKRAQTTSSKAFGHFPDESGRDEHGAVTRQTAVAVGDRCDRKHEP